MNNLSLYEDNEVYTYKSFDSRTKWLQGRLGTIGGSDSSSVIDKNPYKSKEEFILEKKSGVTKDKDNKAMRLGRELEEHIRSIFKIENETKYELQYLPNAILYSNVYKGLSYSPDGLLIDKKSNKKGVWECKTTFCRNKEDLSAWDNQIPNGYYIQCLHSLVVTGFDFVILTAKIKVYDKETKSSYSLLKDYTINREDVEEDVLFLTNSLNAFYDEYIKE
jgi:putative phage-type endonuclease